MEVDTAPLEHEFRNLSKRQAENIADVWFGESQEILADADSQADSNLHPIMQSGYPPEWNGEAWVFGYSHLATVFHEYGADPHIIRARRAQFLAFEWPGAPQWVREAFSETFPTVFFKEVHHPGVPELRFLRGGRDKAISYAESLR